MYLVVVVFIIYPSMLNGPYSYKFCTKAHQSSKIQNFLSLTQPRWLCLANYLDKKYFCLANMESLFCTFSSCCLSSKKTKQFSLTKKFYCNAMTSSWENFKEFFSKMYCFGFTSSYFGMWILVFILNVLYFHSLFYRFR